jgi:hypothetical protein
MTNGLMNLIAGVLMFLAVLVPIIANIWRWGAQKGIQKVIVSVCILLLSQAFSVTGIIGSQAHWDIHAVFAWLIGYAVLYTVGMIVLASAPGGPTRGEFGLYVVTLMFVLNFCFLAVLMARIYTDWKFDTLKKAGAQQGSPTPASKSTPDLLK